MSAQAIQVIQNSEAKFTEIARASGVKVDWATESMFAMQAIQKNEFLSRIADANPGEFQNAIVNIAAIGLSLNPALHHAYLVPRKGAVCLDISYQGLIRLATDTGSVRWMKADVVFENDKFVYHGAYEKPDHDADVFGDRGAFKGVYCVSKTNGGDFLVEVMTAAEIEQIKAASPSARKPDSPWNKWFLEMSKKSVIKRAFKTLPMSDSRMSQAVQLAHVADDVIATQEHDEPVVEVISELEAENITALIKESHANESAFLFFIGVERVEQILKSDYTKAVSALNAKIAKNAENTEQGA